MPEGESSRAPVARMPSAEKPDSTGPGHGRDDPRAVDAAHAVRAAVGEQEVSFPIEGDRGRLPDPRLCGRPAVATIAQDAGADDRLDPAGGGVDTPNTTNDVADEEGLVRADRDRAGRRDFSVEARPPSPRSRAKPLPTYAVMVPERSTRRMCEWRGSAM